MFKLFLYFFTKDRDVYSARLTTEATNKVSILSRDDQEIYFNTLLDEISIKLPVSRERLDIFGNPRYIRDSITNSENLEFYILIVNLPNSTQNDNTVSGVVSDLNTMITYKMVTKFCVGLTDDLDSTFGLKPSGKLIILFKDVVRVEIHD